MEHHLPKTFSNDSRPPSWRIRLDLAVLDYCKATSASPDDVVESVSDFLRGAQTSRERLTRAELRHRTKNEMQFLISSMRNRRRSMTPGVLPECNACIGQVFGLANLNDVLDSESTGQRVDLSDQLARIVTAIKTAFHLDDNIRIEVEAQPILVTAATARNVILILNEALTNAIKHAFGDDGGIVQVALRRTSSTVAELTVDSEGRGSASSSGGREGGSLIDALAAEFDGRVHRIKTSGGFCLSCTFSLV